MKNVNCFFFVKQKKTKPLLLGCLCLKNYFFVYSHELMHVNHDTIVYKEYYIYFFLYYYVLYSEKRHKAHVFDVYEKKVKHENKQARKYPRFWRVRKKSQ